MKRCLAVLSVMLIASILIVTLSFASTTVFSAPTINAESETQFDFTGSKLQFKLADPETQFNVSIAYAYVGEDPTNASYAAANGALMSPVSQYPSSVVVSSTRLQGAQIASCNAEVEVYKVQLKTESGEVENHCYFIGTNYNPSFSSSELSSLFEYVKYLSVSSGSIAVTGNFKFNLTENTPILSHPIGSVGCYCYSNNASIAENNVGLWRAGIPNSISVTVRRIGYITISNDSVIIYKDAPNNSATATEKLSNYGNGFLYNNLVPVAKLAQTDLFRPSP